MNSSLKVYIYYILFPPLQLWKVLLHRFPCFLHCVFHFRVFIELIQIIQIKLDHLVHGTLFREMSVRIAIVAIIFVLATVRFFSKTNVSRNIGKEVIRSCYLFIYFFPGLLLVLIGFHGQPFPHPTGNHFPEKDQYPVAPVDHYYPLFPLQ